MQSLNYKPDSEATWRGNMLISTRIRWAWGKNHRNISRKTNRLKLLQIRLTTRTCLSKPDHRSLSVPVQFMKENGEERFEKATAHRLGQMVLNSSVSGWKTKPTATENSSTSTATSTKASGGMTKPMAMVCTSTSTVRVTRGTGETTCSMATEKKPGQIRAVTRACTSTARNKASVGILGTMGRSTLATGLRIRSTELEFIHG